MAFGTSVSPGAMRWYEIDCSGGYVFHGCGKSRSFRWKQDTVFGLWLLLFRPQGGTGNHPLFVRRRLLRNKLLKRLFTRSSSRLRGKSGRTAQVCTGNRVEVHTGFTNPAPAKPENPEEWSQKLPNVPGCSSSAQATHPGPRENRVHHEEKSAPSSLAAAIRAAGFPQRHPQGEESVEYPPLAQAGLRLLRKGKELGAGTRVH
jgi:hypothetical protein